MKNMLMTAAIVNGMNAHNAEIKKCILAGKVTMVDHCGNVYTLWVWVRPDLTLKYMLECNRNENSLSNMFREPLPTNAVDFDDPTDMFEGIIGTEHRTATVSYEILA